MSEPAQPGSAPARFGTRRLALALAAVVVVSAAARLVTARVPLDQDCGVYAYVAERWAEGELPYRDVWDHKPPLIYATYRAIFAVAPPSSVPVTTTLRVASALADTATAVLVLLLAARLFGPMAGTVAGVLCGLTTALPGLQYESLQPERLVVLFVTGGFLAAAAYVDRRRYAYVALSGLLFGIALALKQTAAPAGALVWAWVTWQAWRREGRGAVKRILIHSVLLAVGALVPWALCAAYFAAKGAFASFWFCTYTYNRHYAAAYRKGTVGQDVARMVRTRMFEHGYLWALAAGGLVWGLTVERLRRGGVLALGWLAAAFLGVYLPGQFAYYYFVPTVAPLALVAGVLVAALVSQLRADTADGPPRGARGAAGMVLIGGWILAAFAVDIAGERLGGLAKFVPYGVWLAPLAGVGVVALLGRWMTARGRGRLVAGACAVLTALTLVGLLGVSALRQRGHVARQRDPQDTNVVAAKVAAQLRELTTPDERVYVWGSRAQIYVLARRLTVSPYLYNTSFHVSLDKAFLFQPERRAEIMAGLEEHTPPYIVTTETRTLAGFPELKQYLADRYEFERDFPGKPLAPRLYRRKDAPRRQDG